MCSVVSPLPSTIMQELGSWDLSFKFEERSSGEDLAERKSTDVNLESSCDKTTTYWQSSLFPQASESLVTTQCGIYARNYLRQFPVVRLLEAC